MYKIYLDDGTEIEAVLNENTWESETKINPELFKNNTSNVSYETPDGENVFLGACRFMMLTGYDGKYIFALNPLSETEKETIQVEQNTANIDYIAMMTDVELPEEVI